jgi:hypothetical protein
MKPSSAKAKGRRFQQWVAQKISHLTGIPFGKDRDIESREMGQSGVDIKLYGEARRLFPWSVECKNQQSWSIHDWIKQAKENIMEDTDWILFCKRNHMDPVVVIDAETFFKLCEEIITSRRD